MQRKVILTCALTGAGDTASRNPAIPVTPKEIAEAAREAADAGAGVAHIHVRDPQTGRAARDPALYKETLERIRDDGTDIVLNVTAGMGADYIPDPDVSNRPAEGTDMATAAERVAHIEALKPMLCTLDCGSMNYADMAYVSTPDQLRIMAGKIRDAGVKPEIEVFELGHIWMAKTLIEEGLIERPPLFQLCLGIPYGAEATTETLVALKQHLPEDAQWAAFSIGRLQMPFVAQAYLAGGNVRVGLEDNIYLEKGVKATNGALVEKAIKIIRLLGGDVMSPEETRRYLGLATEGLG